MKSAQKLFIVLSFLFASMTSAQIPNNSFENWSGYDPTSWVSTNGLNFFGNPYSVFKSGDAHSGSFACEINCVHITAKPSNVFVPDYAGSIFLGKQVGTTSYMGIPYTYKPTQVEYWFKFRPVAIDTANTSFLLTRWNNSTAKRDTIGIALISHIKMDTIYTKATATFNYLSAQTPDTVAILVSAIALSSDHAGSKFLIDDIDLTGGNVGLASIEPHHQFYIYPNPVKETLNILFENFQQNSSLELVDLSGNVIFKNFEFSGIQLAINTASFAKGMYLLKVLQSGTMLFKKIIIE